MQNNLELFIGKNNFVWFIGVVEDIADPLTLGRAKVRCFGFHPENKADVPTIDLPWAQVIQPTTSASVSGVGWSPNGLKPGSWVVGFFADGDTAQFPMVIGTLPGIHRPSEPSSYIGNSGAGYLTDASLYSGDPVEEGPHFEQNTINPTGGATIKDDGSYLTKQNISNWPLKIYKPTPSLGDTGLACRDGKASLRIHYATALALEQLTRDFGRTLGINSAYRTPAYNATRKGAAKASLHIQGRAFDISYSSIGGKGAVKKFAQLAVKNGFVGFGLYNSFIHIDTGRGRVWEGARAKWFTDAIKAAGWYPGKPGLQDVKTNPVTANTASNTATTTTESDRTSSEAKSKKEVAELLKEKAKANGYTDVQTAAILASADAESDFNPNALGDKGTSYGLFQWHDTSTGSGRWSGLKDYAASTGGDWKSAETQADYFFYELNGSESRAGNALRNASTTGEAADAMASFERFAGYDNPNSAQSVARKNSTQAYYENELSTAGVDAKGFKDPTNSLPFGGYRGKPSTHHAARGVNGNMYQPELTHNFSSRQTAFPVAADRGTIGEPDLGEAPQYPYNITYASISGHMMEFDDTPGTERINIQHKSGSRLAIGAKGTTLHKTVGNAYRVDGNDSYHMVMGNYKMSVKDDIDIRSTADVTIHSDGMTTVIVRNDNVEQVSGKKDVHVGEVLQIKAQRIILEADRIDFVSHGDINFEAGGNVNMRSGGSTSLSSGSDMKVYSGGQFNADAAGELHWLEGTVKELPENTAASTDLGKVPKRAVIEKAPYHRSNPDSVPTMEAAMDVYAPNDSTDRST